MILGIAKAAGPDCGDLGEKPQLMDTKRRDRCLLQFEAAAEPESLEVPGPPTRPSRTAKSFNTRTFRTFCWRDPTGVQSVSPRAILTRNMLSAPRHHYSFEEYLELEEIAGVRHEFFGGEIYAMAGGTPEHAAMAAVVTTILGGQLGSSPCRVYSSDLRVRVAATGLATYPDVTVICGRSERDSNSKTHVTNPKVLVEVLSPATAEYDRGEKLENYRQIPTLEAVVLIDHEVPKIELWTREAEGWVERRFSSGQIVPLDPIGCVLAVDEVYAAARDA